MSYELENEKKANFNIEDETPKEDVTGIAVITPGEEELPANLNLQRAKEEDIVTSLLAAAEFRNDDSLMKEIVIARNGREYFTFKIRPVSDEEAAFARKKARVMKKNARGKRIPVEGEIDTPKFNSHLIYIATTEDDRAKIWGNQAILNKYDLMEPWESISVLLTAGEKTSVVSQISEISGMDDDEDDDEVLDDVENYAKNS